MRKGKITLVALTVGVALAGAAEARARGPVDFSGEDCHETLIAMPVSADRAAAVLPVGWTPYSAAAGQAVLGVAVLACTQLRVQGSPVARGVLSDVGIQVVSPEDGFPAWYQLWQHTSSDELHDAMSRLGVAGKHAKLSSDASRSGAVSTPAAWVDAPGAQDYSLRGTVSGGADVGGSAPVWWHEGRHGRVKLVYQVTEATAAAGTGTLQAMPGSTLAWLVGAAQRDGAGALLRMDFQATGQLIPPSAGSP